jgi:hypothetical protein
MELWSRLFDREGRNMELTEVMTLERFLMPDKKYIVLSDD